MISTQAQFLTSIPVYETDLVYRQIPLNHLVKSASDKKKRFPNEAHFAPHADGLSVHWNAYCTVESIFKLIGISHKYGSLDFKNPREYRLFSIPVIFLRSLDNVKVEHSPVFNGNPAPIGTPNNYAHASVIYGIEEVEIRIKLRDYCSENYNISHSPIDFALLDPEIDELRSRLDNTPYHRLPFQLEPDRMSQ